MFHNLKRKIDILFVVILLILLSLFYTVLQSTNFTRKSSALVSITQDFLYNLEKVESNVTDIETAHRGFIITGNESFLDPIENALAELNNSLQTLQRIGDNSPEQKEKIRHLHALVEEKINLSNEAIALRKSEGQLVALNFVATGSGKIVMDSIRLVNKELEMDEIQNLNNVTNDYESQIIKQNSYFLVFAGFIFLLLILFYLRIRSDADTMEGFTQKQNELIDALNHQNKQLDDFAHLTSHNIRSPAVNIFSLISLIDEKSTIEDYKFIFEKLSQVSTNLNETLNELIEVLHVKKNNDIERQQIRFDVLFQKVTQSLQGDIILNNAEITSNFKIAEIEYPKAYLESVFYNLLSNSIKYRSSERPLKVHVETDYVKEKIQLTVSDNGMGIDLKKYGHLVFGLRKVFHKNQNAKGIGLFMTKTQIEALGGQILVESEVDKGTTFKVVF